MKRMDIFTRIVYVSRLDEEPGPDSKRKSMKATSRTRYHPFMSYSRAFETCHYNLTVRYVDSLPVQNM